MFVCLCQALVLLLLFVVGAAKSEIEKKTELKMLDRSDLGRVED